jgi:hypothetical protein
MFNLRSDSGIREGLLLTETEIPGNSGLKFKRAKWCKKYELKLFFDVFDTNMYLKLFIAQ